MGEAPKLSKVEKIKFVKKHEAVGSQEQTAMEKKYLKIQNMALFHENLAETLKINKNDLDKYAKRSPKFHDTLSGFAEKASAGHDKFKDWFKNHLKRARNITTREKANLHTLTLENIVKGLRETTIKQFEKIKTEMTASIKKMIETEKKREILIANYTKLPSRAVKDISKSRRAAVLTKLRMDLKYNDDLTLLKTRPYDEVKKKFDAGYRMNVLLRLEKIAKEPLNPQFAQFSKIRAERSKLTQELLSLDPQATFFIPDDFPDTTWGYNVDLNDKSFDNPWPLGTHITNAKKLLPTLEKEDVNLINKHIEYQNVALTTMIESKKAEKALNDLTELDTEFTSTWEKNGADPNKTQKLMLSYAGIPKEIDEVEIDKGKYVSRDEAGKIINTAKASMVALAEGIQKADEFGKLKSNLVALNNGIDTGKWSLTNIDSPLKMTKALEALRNESTQLLAERKRGKRGKRRA